jgi:hypothetical protein
MPIFAGVGANQRGPKSGHDNLADLDTLGYDVPVICTPEELLGD